MYKRLSIWGLKPSTGAITTRPRWQKPRNQGTTPAQRCTLKFPMNDDLGKLSHLDKSKLNFVIWTTTIWTLPGNLAIALNPNESYVIVKNEDNGDVYRRRSPLREGHGKIGKVEHYTVVESHPGSFYEGNMLASHLRSSGACRLYRDGLRTGCVHTAPGFGADDLSDPAKRYGMDMVVPVDDQGRHTDYAGKTCRHDRRRLQPRHSQGHAGSGRAVRLRGNRPLVSALLALQEADHLPRNPAVGSARSNRSRTRRAPRATMCAGCPHGALTA